MTEFDSQANLVLTIDQRSLRNVKQQLESEIGETEVGVSRGSTPSAQMVTDGGSTGGRAERRARQEWRWARRRTEDISEILEILHGLDSDGDGGGLTGPLRSLGGGLGGAALGLGAIGAALGVGMAGAMEDVELPELEVPDIPFPDSIPLDHPSDIPLSYPDDIPLSYPDNIPLDFPPDIPLSYPDNIPLDFPDSVPLSYPESIPVDAPVEIPVGAPAEIPVDAPVEIPVDAPAEIPLTFPEIDLPQGGDFPWAALGGGLGAGAGAAHILRNVATSGGGRAAGVTSPVFTAEMFGEDNPTILDQEWWDAAGDQVDAAGDFLSDAPIIGGLFESSDTDTSTAGREADVPTPRSPHSLGHAAWNEEQFGTADPTQISTNVGGITVEVDSADQVTDAVDVIRRELESSERDLQRQIDDLARDIERGGR